MDSKTLIIPIQLFNRSYWLHDGVSCLRDTTITFDMVVDDGDSVGMLKKWFCRAYSFASMCIN